MYLYMYLMWCSKSKMSKLLQNSETSITTTCLYNFDPLNPYFYIVKLGFTGQTLFFLFLLKKHRLRVLVETVLTSTHNLCFEQKYEKKICSFFYLKISVFGRKIFYIFE